MITVAVSETIKKIFQPVPQREKKTRTYTRRMIKKYGKTLRKLSHE